MPQGGARAASGEAAARSSNGSPVVLAVPSSARQRQMTLLMGAVRRRRPSARRRFAPIQRAARSHGASSPRRGSCDVAGEVPVARIDVDISCQLRILGTNRSRPLHKTNGGYLAQGYRSPVRQRTSTSRAINDSLKPVCRHGTAVRRETRQLERPVPLSFYQFSSTSNCADARTSLHSVPMEARRQRDSTSTRTARPGGRTSPRRLRGLSA
jgi:hypothetical protein